MIKLEDNTKFEPFEPGAMLMIDKGWKIKANIYVDGFLCKCGRLFPAIHPFPTFMPCPNVCPTCGEWQIKMRRGAIQQILLEKPRGIWPFNCVEQKVVYGIGKIEPHKKV